MTYLTFISVLVFSSFFYKSRYKNFILMIMGFFTFFIIFSFSSSKNFDHSTYIWSLENGSFNLFEPLFSILMYLYDLTNLHEVSFLSLVFLLIFIVSYIWGDRLYLFITICYLAPLGVVSVRFFLGALLISIIVNNKNKLFSFLPIGFHYATIISVIFYYLGNWKYITLSSFALVLFFLFFPELFFLLLSHFLGISYFRYSAGFSFDTMSISNMLKYLILPFSILSIYIFSNVRFNEGRMFILSLLFSAVILKFGFSGVEVVSRVSTILMLTGMYLILKLNGRLTSLIVIIYISLHALFYGFFGWDIYPDVYQESNAVWGAYER